MGFKLKPISAGLLATGTIILSSMTPAVASEENVVAEKISRQSAATTLVRLALLDRSNIDRQVATAIHLYGKAKSIKDHDRAFALFLGAAERGSAEAQFRLANMYLDCEHVINDDDEAMKWLNRAAAKGHQQAAFLYEYLLNSEFEVGC